MRATLWERMKIKCYSGNFRSIRNRSGLWLLESLSRVARVSLLGTALLPREDELARGCGFARGRWWKLRKCITINSVRTFFMESGISGASSEWEKVIHHKILWKISARIAKLPICWSRKSLAARDSSLSGFPNADVFLSREMPEPSQEIIILGGHVKDPKIAIGEKRGQCHELIKN